MAALRWVVASSVAVAAVLSASAGERPGNIAKADFRDRVFACWLGKALGGTLGQPFEGRHGPNDVLPAAKLSKGIANDEADLEILWLAALEENDARADARTLGRYWLRYVTVDWNEYGVGKKNMLLGLLPPLSGEFGNPQWKHSNGAWARAEVWGCLAPGCPGLAARLAWEDACVDHGVAREGTLAAMFIAALESAGFVESDRERLIAAALAVIPADSESALAVRTALAAWKAGKDWRAARLEVIEATKTGWFMAPRNVAFILIGWLYGAGDYRRTLVTTLNCGDDTDSTVATVASLLGILCGSKAIDPEWRQAVGDQVKTCILAADFRASPKTVEELADRTVAMAKRVLAARSAPVAIGDGPTDVRLPHDLPAADKAAIAALLGLPPCTAIWNEGNIQVRINYQVGPLIEPGVPRKVAVAVHNRSGKALSVALEVADPPAGWQIQCSPATAAAIEPQATAQFELDVTAPATIEKHANTLGIKLRGAPEAVTVPLVLLAKGREPRPPGTKTAVPSTSKGNLALASLGSAATSDSELDREPGCTPQVIDGLIGGEDNRWHSSIATPHPHWVQVKLPKPARLGRAIIHFADPRGMPVSFRGLVLPEGEREWKEVFRVADNRDTAAWRGQFAPVVTDTFRLVIEKSVNPVSLNAAQVSEIELFAPEAPAEPRLPAK